MLNIWALFFLMGLVLFLSAPADKVKQVCFPGPMFFMRAGGQICGGQVHCKLHIKFACLYVDSTTVSSINHLHMCTHDMQSRRRLPERTVHSEVMCLSVSCKEQWKSLAGLPCGAETSSISRCMVRSSKCILDS